MDNIYNHHIVLDVQKEFDIGLNGSILVKDKNSNIHAGIKKLFNNNRI